MNEFFECLHSILKQVEDGQGVCTLFEILSQEALTSITSQVRKKPVAWKHYSYVRYDGRLPRLADALMTWRVQTGSGLTIFPAEPVRPGLTFALWFRLAGAYATAVGRVVYVTSEPDRAGFAYGTLPAHPEQGEEAFHLVRQGAQLLFRVRAFSRPRHPLARLGAPVSRVLQQRMNQAYLKTMRDTAGTTG